MPELSRETVTFLFTDIEGSTMLLQTLGDEYPNAVHEHRRLLSEAVEHAGGVVYAALGDEVSAVFGSGPEAVAAACFAQRSFANAAWPGGGTVLVRIGIHTGRPAGELGEYLGLDVHRTARICSAGHGGQVLISQVVYEALGDGLPGRRDLPRSRHAPPQGLARARTPFPARHGRRAERLPSAPQRRRKHADS